MKKLLVVDDSSFMRVAIKKMLTYDPKIQVAGEAVNGKMALDMVKTLKPDIITMDIEMPEMDGLWATARIMASHPCPIIMLSAHTKAGAASTFKALELGAVDFIPKGSDVSKLDLGQIGRELREKLYYWIDHPLPTKKSSAPPPSPKPTPTLSAKPVAVTPSKVDLVVVGVSTGGPKTLPDFLKATGPLTCPMVIALHMPAVFTNSFADHLKQKTQLEVIEGKEALSLQSEMVVVVPGGTDGLIKRSLAKEMMLFLREHKHAPVHPWADALFKSALDIASHPVAVILTGMGRDGTEGAVQFIEKKRPVLLQEPSTCVVAGMPSSAIEANAVSEVLNLEGLGNRLSQWVGKGK